MNLWLTISLIGVMTFGIRLSFIALAGRWQLPSQVEDALRYVPVAVLTAIVVPDLVYHNGALDLWPDNARLIAGIIAIGIAWRTRNILLTLIGGMGVLWLLRFAFHLP